MPALGPRLVIAGTSSGVGKTTVATGLMAALSARGVAVAPAKAGPDFVDPGYHALATGRRGRNLDGWLCSRGGDVPDGGERRLAALAGRAAAGADVLVVEGVMGMFDGSASGGPVADTASLARLLAAPLLLVVDASAMSGSVAALVHGFSSWDPSVPVAGVILNRVGSDGHETLLREALAPLGVPVLGALRRDDRLTWRDRHLGLVPVVEDPAGVGARLSRLAAAVPSRVDLGAVMTLARSAPPLTVPPVELPSPVPGPPPVVAVAGGRAFSFVYADNLEALQAAGAELVPFDPAADPAVPEGAVGLYAGGGFPEVYAEALAANEPLLADVRRRVAAGTVTWAECGGLLWLARSLDGHPLAGVVAADAVMTGRLSLGYRRASLRRDCPLGAAGTALAGHEFHYSAIDPPGDGLCLSGRFGSGRAGWATPSLLASYLHLHCGADPAPAAAFVAACAARAAVGRMA